MEEINKSLHIIDGKQLTDEIHRYGIPVRMLGLLLNRISSSKIILSELITRVICDILKEILRSFKRNEESALTSLIIDNLNLIFGVGKNTQEYYKIAIVPMIQNKFQVYSIFETTGPTNISSFDFSKKIDKFSILNRIEQKTGIKVVGNFFFIYIVYFLITISFKCFRRCS